jgi:hypothetical protein
MRPADYKSLGIRVQPLHQWFLEVCSSLKAAIGPEEVTLTVLSPNEEPAPSRRRVALSIGAATWRKGGKRLKQFAESAIEFDLPAAAP